MLHFNSTSIRLLKAYQITFQNLIYKECKVNFNKKKMSEKYHQAFSKNAWFKKKKNLFFLNFEAFTLLFLNLLSYSFLNQWWNTKVYVLILLSWQKVSLAVMFNWIYVRFGKSNITSKHCWFSILNLLFICWIKMKKKS